jgi:KUP system potassium uptake protein
LKRLPDRLLIGLARTANDATDFFQTLTGRVIEVGTQVTVRLRQRFHTFA